MTVIHYIVGRNLGHLNPCVANLSRFMKSRHHETVKVYAFRHTHSWLRSNLPKVKIRSFSRQKVKEQGDSMLEANLVMHDWREEVALLKEARHGDRPIIGGIYHSDMFATGKDTSQTRKFKEQIRDISQRTTDIFFHINLRQPSEIPTLSTRYVPIPLIARGLTQTPEKVREMLGLRKSEPFVLVQMGGGVGKYRYKYMDEWYNTVNQLRIPYPIVVANQLEGVAFSFNDRIIQAPLFDNGRDLVNAATVIVSKPGMGILMDCISTGTPLLALPADTKERAVKNMMLADLVGNERCLAPAHLSSKKLGHRIDEMIQQTTRIQAAFEQVPHNGADVIARSMELLSGHTVDELPELYEEILKLTPFKVKL